MGRQSLASTFRFLLSCCILAASINAHAATPIVTTVAGGYIGDGKPATSASFAWPDSVVTDVAGNIYVADQLNCRIRKISPKGVINTFAGTGICGYSGDGGPATSAMIFYPVGLAFDGQGSLLFGDSVNQRIRKVTSAGTITTVAGNGTSGYSGDGGLATQASISGPSGISVDPLGNVYIADSFNFAIRMVDPAGVIHTVAGTNTPGFSGDGGPAISAHISDSLSVNADNNGNFYIADGGNQRVRKVDSSGIITTYAGNGSIGNTGSGGPATSAGFGAPKGLLLLGGKLYISTEGNIWSVDLATQLIDLIGGSPILGSEGFNGDGNTAPLTDFLLPTGMGSDPAGNLLVADRNNGRIRKIDSSQIVTTIAGGFVGDGRPGTAASLNLGFFDHIGFDLGGNLYIADASNNRIRKVSPKGVITTFAGTGIKGHTGDGGPASDATLSIPAAVAADRNGNVFIADGGFGGGPIRKVDSSGMISTFSNINVVLGGALAVDMNGNLYASDGLAAVWKITPSGSASVVAGMPNHYGYSGDGFPATGALLNVPGGIAVDAAGNLFIADSFNARIRKVDTSGIISTVAGNGTRGYSGDGGPATAATLSEPSDVAVDGKGNVYVTDRNRRVRVVHRSGIIQTLAGTGISGYNGNRLAATATNLNPSAVAVSPTGVVYVLDEDSMRVRKIH